MPSRIHGQDKIDQGIITRGEIKKQIEEDLGNVVYEGRSYLDAEQSASVWQIRRTRRVGGTTYIEWPVDPDTGLRSSEYKFSWEDRTTYFSAVPFTNALSTNFDGVDAFVTLGDITELNLATTFTISFWAKVSLPVATSGAVFQKYTGSKERTAVNFNPISGIVVNLANGSNSYGRVVPPSDNAWHHYVAVYNGSGATNADKLKLYRDGLLQSLTFSGTIPATTYDGSAVSAEFGRLATANYLAGLVDEVTLWSQNFSASEVAALYNGGVPNDPTEHSQAASLISWWRMGDGDTYPTITDQVGTYDGTMNNMVAGDFQSDVP